MERCGAGVLRDGGGASCAGTVGVVSGGQHFCLRLFVEFTPSRMELAMQEHHTLQQRHSRAARLPCLLRSQGAERWAVQVGGIQCEGGGGVGQGIIFVVWSASAQLHSDAGPAPRLHLLLPAWPGIWCTAAAGCAKREQHSTARAPANRPLRADASPPIAAAPPQGHHREWLWGAFCGRVPDAAWGNPPKPAWTASSPTLLAPCPLQCLRCPRVCCD